MGDSQELATPTGATADRFVVVGPTTTARRVCAALRGLGHAVEHLVSPRDSEVAEAVSRPNAGVAILFHSDELSLRYSLTVAHAAPTATVVSSIFDATISAQMEELMPTCAVTSPGVLAAPILAAACLEPNASALVPTGRRVGAAFHATDHDITVTRWQGPPTRLSSVRAWLGRQLIPHDVGSTLVTVGLLGMFAFLVIDWVWLTRSGIGPASAFADAVTVVTTVGPLTRHGAAYEIFAGVAMLVTTVLSGMFIAGLVDQLLGPRFIGMFGRRSLPRKNHVIVVGLGQVGLRLCRHLLALGIPVVGVERDDRSRYLEIAKNLGIPVVVGHGGDRILLERLRVAHATALASVGSADLDNIAVAVAARALGPARVVIRAGEDEAVSETASLLPLGATVDITELSAAYVIARLLGHEAGHVFPNGADVLVETLGGEILTWSTSHRDGCVHTEAMR